MITGAEIDALFAGDCYQGWEKFYQKYGGAGRDFKLQPKTYKEMEVLSQHLQKLQSTGINTFSRVGFNSDKTQSVVYFGYQGVCLAGEGRLIFLKKEKNDWKIAETLRLWIS